MFKSSFNEIQAASAASTFTFNIGDLVKVSADRGIYKSKDLIEVYGNVVIFHAEEALYGEKGIIDKKLGTMYVEGNVRLVTSLMTLYAQDLTYHFQDGKVEATNARLYHKDYSIWGDYISRLEPETFFGMNSEYSTCYDCPESWSVYGKEIKITFGEYITIRNALIKSSSVPLLYMPFMFFPIKKERQSGLLFPQFALSFREGLKYRQPIFWAIDDYKDATFVPWANGARGYGGEFEYRQNLGEKKSVQLDTLMMSDQIYLPNRVEDKVQSGTSFRRDFYQYEHHYQIGNFFNHHLFYTQARDLDIHREYYRFTTNRFLGSELPSGGYINLQNLFFDGGIEGYHHQNLLIENPTAFDHRYVQTMPRLHFAFEPIPLIQTDLLFLKKIFFGHDTQVNNFRQDHPYERIWYRNAQRMTFNNYLLWNLGNYGPIGVNTKLNHNFQYYKFTHRPDPDFRSNGFTLSTNAFFEIERIYGLAYNQNIDMNLIKDSYLEEKMLSEQLKKEKTEEKKIEQEKMLADLPDGPENPDQKLNFSKPSYKHSTFFNLRHLYTPIQSFQGNTTFRKQIESAEGPFDSQDIPFAVRNRLAPTETRKEISVKNSVELQIFNSLSGKSANVINPETDQGFLANHFNYYHVAHINISQGYEIFDHDDRLEYIKYKREHGESDEINFSDHLTRLHTWMGFPFYEFQFSFDDYFFWQQEQHVLSAGISRQFERFSLRGALGFDSLSQTKSKQYSFTVALQPMDKISLIWDYAHDMVTNQFLLRKYSIYYLPDNNCWKSSIAYMETRDDQQVIFNFFVNFGNSKYVSILGPDNEVPR